MRAVRATRMISTRNGCEHVLDVFADGAVAHQQDGFAGEFFELNGRMQGARVVIQLLVNIADFRAAAPIAGALNIKVSRQEFEHGENGGECPLGGGDVVRAAGIADGHMRSYGIGKPFRARHERQHQAHAAQVRPDAQGTRDVGIGNPYIDIDGVIKPIGKRDEFNPIGHHA